jgi:hypothetical protein
MGTPNNSGDGDQLPGILAQQVKPLLDRDLHAARNAQRFYRFAIRGITGIENVACRNQ